MKKIVKFEFSIYEWRWRYLGVPLRARLIGNQHDDHLLSIVLRRDV